MSLLSRKFSKVLKKKSQASKRYSSKKPSDFNLNKYTCYGCGEQGHIKAECPNNESKDKADFKNEKRGKAKKAYVAWDDNEVSSSSSSDEEANMCLRASVSSSMSSSSLIKCNNYYQFLEAFNEIHEEANRLVLSHNRLKSLNNWLENRVKSLEEKLRKTKEDFENLDLIYKNSTCSCDSKFCENCENLERKIHYLLKTMDKLTTGKSNFEDVLVSQNCVFGKVGLGFYPQSKGNGISKPFSSVPEKQSVKRSIQLVVTYFYCMKKGHWVRLCKFQKFIVPKGILNGFQDVLIVPKTSLTQRVPSSLRDQILWFNKFCFVEIWLYLKGQKDQDLKNICLQVKVLSWLYTLLTFVYLKNLKDNF